MQLIQAEIFFLLSIYLFFVQSECAKSYPTPKFGFGQLNDFYDRICKHYCDDFSQSSNRHSRTLLFCFLNCPSVITATPTTKKPIVTTTTTVAPSARPEATTALPPGPSPAPRPGPAPGPGPAPAPGPGPGPTPAPEPNSTPAPVPPNQ